jgi:hypothetical protein
MKCDKCDHELTVGDFPYCPHGRGANSAIGDDIPGGIEIRHGICNEDGTPRRYYTHSAMRAEAKRRGVYNHVEHVPNPSSGSDRSKWTTRWI